MIRSELIQKIANENPHLRRDDADRVVGTILEEIILAMMRGRRVEIRGFGVFEVRERGGRIGRNPRDGAAVPVEQKHIPFFRAGKLLLERLNGRA